MKKHSTARLEDLPNVGPAMAGDLYSLGIHTPADLAQHDPLATYLRLSTPQGERHDPCVLYTLMSAQHYLQTGQAVVWWKFTQAGKALLGISPETRRR
jgi:Pathogenicity locus